MSLTNASHKEQLRAAGWHSRGYLRHFDGRAIPQFKFWMEEYFDRYVRNADHFRNTVNYIENNPVKAGLCSKPSDWPFSSAWFREHGKK